jgi:hypothetical protein
MPGDVRDQNTERLKVISKPNSDLNVNNPRGSSWQRITPLSKGVMGVLDHGLTIPLNPPLGKGASNLRIPTISWVRKRIYSLRQVLK